MKLVLNCFLKVLFVILIVVKYIYNFLANFLYAKKILNFSIRELQQIAKISAYEANIILQAACAAELMSNEQDGMIFFSLLLFELIVDPSHIKL